jgi:hypothetical protein
MSADGGTERESEPCQQALEEDPEALLNKEYEDLV